MDQVEYQERYNSLRERYEKIKDKLEKIEEKRGERRDKREKMYLFISTLKKQDFPLTEFDEELWVAVVDKVTVLGRNNIRFLIKDGRIIKL